MRSVVLYRKYQVGGENKLDIREEYPRWGFLEIILAYFGIMIAGMAYAWIDDRSGGIAGMLGLANNEFNAFVIAYIVQFIATIFIVVLFTVVVNRARWNELGVKSASGEAFIKYGLLGGLLLLGMVMILGYPLNYLQPDLEPQVFEKLLRSINTIPALLLMLFMGSILAPVSEELFYRGMMYPVFRRRLGTGWGAVAAGTVFGLVHWDLWRTIPLAVGGALLCYIYEKTGSILVSALAHGVWNGTLALIIYFTMVYNL
jgi:hypothetical protein